MRAANRSITSSGTTLDRAALRCLQTARGVSKNTASALLPRASAILIQGRRSFGVSEVASRIVVSAPAFTRMASRKRSVWKTSRFTS